MGWFWANRKYNVPETNRVENDTSTNAKCPVNHKNNVIAAKCPINSSSLNTSSNSNSNAILNPLNNMPILSNDMAPGQKVKLSTERVFSSIPKGEVSEEGVWEYPSPQQMLNAMLRKGKGGDIPEDAVESMVEIHNFLNEAAWQQIVEWEAKHTKVTKVEPRLLSFTGRPNDLSPRAQTYLFLSKWFPLTFNDQPPFDRHDWTVLRSNQNNQGWSKIRYVIDYYSAPDDEETGMPAFVLDTRPALDNVGNAIDRFSHWFHPLYVKAMGDKDEN